MDVVVGRDSNHCRLGVKSLCSSGLILLHLEVVRLVPVSLALAAFVIAQRIFSGRVVVQTFRVRSETIQNENTKMS